MATSRVLVIEDDPSIAAGVVQGLRRRGFEVELSADGHDGVLRALSDPFDILVLDLLLPGQSGFEVLRQLRSRTRVPVIVLSARTGLDDRLASFDLGAVDFVSKPFFMEELVARIQARLPRAEPAPTRVVTFGAVEVDLDALTVRVGGEPTSLTRTELTLLTYLIERAGRALTRAQVAEDVLSMFDDVSARTVDAHVARLRKKLGPDGAHIVTVWSIGYRFDATLREPR